MKESIPDSPRYTDRIQSWVRSRAANRPSKHFDSNQLPTSNLPTLEPTQSNSKHGAPAMSASPGGTTSALPASGGADTAEDGCSGTPTVGGSSQTEKPGPVLGRGGDGKHPQDDHPQQHHPQQHHPQQQEPTVKDNIPSRILRTIKFILFHSKLNLLLVFVPIGIAVEQVPGIAPGIIFAMNAIAIIPLAGLLSLATEAVARKLGDSLGALLNITFGNAVELIIFIIALVKNEIRIVQASLLGSILANLLLILGMSFFLGGLRFREQIYNSTVTQMSACLLSLSVISLVLPTAFHASFSDSKLADAQSLKISRGTSVILLLVYIIYLMFQLLSHSYMYESTPQHIIDKEATPGPVANWLDSSSSESSSSSDSDSSDSDQSRETVGERMRRAIRRHRKSSIISVDTSEGISTTRTRTPTRSPSFGTTSEGQPSEETPRTRIFKTGGGIFDAPEDAIEDEKSPRHKKRDRHRKPKKHRKHHKHKSRRNGSQEFMDQPIDEEAAVGIKGPLSPGEPRRVDFAMSQSTSNAEGMSEIVQTRSSPFQGLRGTLRPVARSLAPTVFTSPTDTTMPAVPSGPVPRVRYGIRRTNSLPDRLNQFRRPPGAMMPSQIPLAAVPNGAVADAEENVEELSRRSAVFLLLISTALVAVCAEFMVDSINGLVKTSSIGEIFIGLIILPIVGNAAEHVTAITVAMKNKMDLAIGVAVGSSIQIALFITPLIVIIGWIMNREMTLYFTLFETVCLFVSAFITNFLVLDGRSNYLEGALLLATYVIISVVAFFYPNAQDTSGFGA